MHVCAGKNVGKNVGMQISLCGRVLQERGNLTKKEQQELRSPPPPFVVLFISLCGTEARQLNFKGARGSVPLFPFPPFFLFFDFVLSAVFL